MARPFRFPHSTWSRPLCRAGIATLALLGCAVVPEWAADLARRHAPPAGAPDSVEVPPAPVLTVAVRSDGGGDPARPGTPFPVDREIARDIAERLGARLELVLEDDETRMIDLLLSGNVDVVAAHLSVTPGRERRVAFSLAYGVVHDLLVERTDDRAPESTWDFDGKTIGIRGDITTSGTVERIRALWPGIEIRCLPTGWPGDALDLVVSGELDAVVIDSYLWGTVSPVRESLAATRVLAEHPVAVAVRPDDLELRRLANECLTSRALIGPSAELYTDDLDGLVDRGRLRLLTRRGPDSYFVHYGTELGFEYELVKRFADRLGLELEVVVPPTPADLLPWLLEGKGDVVAAGLAVSSDADDVLFTRPYRNAYQVIAVREGDPVRDLDGLRGRTVHVHASSPHYATLRELRLGEDDFEIDLVAEDVDFEEILDRVEDGTWDATVCDSNVLQMERAGGRRLQAAFPLKAIRHAWAVRPSNPGLKEALDAFLRTEYRGVDYNVLRHRYFQDARTIAAARADTHSGPGGRISPYDDVIRGCAAEYGLDWRLVAAQMHQESRFDVDRVSAAGARGLMQVMPSTAAELGYADVSDAESSTRAGTQYLRLLIDRFEPELPLATRIRFALASYNAGKGHVDDARALAARCGWSPDRWYGSVDQAMLLLQLPEYYRDARHGYCRGGETVRYVREIDRKYGVYVAQGRIEFASAIGSREGTR